MLTSEDRAILDFEQSWWQQPGAKDQAIEFSLGLSSGDYYERLRSLLAFAPARVYDPLTVKRVLTLIDPTADSELAV